MPEIKPAKQIQAPYTVTIDDHEQILEVTGSPVTFPPGLRSISGFYTTIVNARGGTIQLLTPNSRLFSPLGGTTLTMQFEQCTVYVGNSGWTAPTL